MNFVKSIVKAIRAGFSESPVSDARDRPRMKIGDRFVVLLHERHMKPAGFKKKARTFSLVHADYEENYNIQGSAWNSPESPWRFYVNCGLSFPDLPRVTKGSGFFNIHAYQRLGLFVRDALPHYDVTGENLEATVDEIGQGLLRCSDYFSRRYSVIRDSYVRRDFHLLFPRDPELYRD